MTAETITCRHPGLKEDFILSRRPVSPDENVDKLATLAGWGQAALNQRMAEGSLRRTRLQVYSQRYEQASMVAVSSQNMMYQVNCKRYCNSTYSAVPEPLSGIVQELIPDLFQPDVMCAGYVVCTVQCTM